MCEAESQLMRTKEEDNSAVYENDSNMLDVHGRDESRTCRTKGERAGERVESREQRERERVSLSSSTCRT